MPLRFKLLIMRYLFLIFSAFPLRVGMGGFPAFK